MKDMRTIDECNALLEPYYWIYKTFAIPANGKYLLTHKLIKGGLINSIPHSLKQKHLEWLNSGGIINELSGMDEVDIEEFSKQELNRYVTHSQSIGWEKNLDTASDIQKMRNLHIKNGIKFAMKIYSITKNPTDGITIHKRVFYPLFQTMLLR